MKTDFRKQVVALMKKKKVSAAKLSRMVDLNSGTVYKFLQGKSQVSAENLGKILDALEFYSVEKK